MKKKTDPPKVTKTALVSSGTVNRKEIERAEKEGNSALMWKREQDQRKSNQAWQEKEAKRDKMIADREAKAKAHKEKVAEVQSKEAATKEKAKQTVKTIKKTKK
jgi:hypothetical protein